jgi:hypothetical protein
MLPNPDHGITSIAKLLGVSPGTLYNHIPDLRELRPVIRPARPDHRAQQRDPARADATPPRPGPPGQQPTTAWNHQALSDANELSSKPPSTSADPVQDHPNVGFVLTWAGPHLRLRHRDRNPRGRGRRPRPQRGRPAVRTAPVPDRGGLPRGGPDHRQRHLLRPPQCAVGRGHHRGRLRLHPLLGLRPEHLHRVALALPAGKKRGSFDLLDGHARAERPGLDQF